MPRAGSPAQLNSDQWNQQKFRNSSVASPDFLDPALVNCILATLNGVKGFQFFDKALDGRKNMIVGANKEGFHAYTEQDSFPPNETFYDDFRLVNEGEPCPICGAP